MSDEFYRIRRLPPYVFAEVNALKAKKRASGVDIIDFGMGNPDLSPAPHIIKKLIETAEKPNVHRYSASRGISGLRRAQAAYYERRFGVTLDPEMEVVVTLGSKEGLANLAMAITTPGDVILTPNPSYPLHPYGFIIAGATLCHVPALYDGVFNPELYLRSLHHAVRYSVPKPSVMIVNFPSNPTAQVVTLDFYKEIVVFAKKYNIWVLSDLAYAEIYFDYLPPPSILEVPGAKDVAVEFTSMSKTFSMAGWRIGFAVGNQRLVAALARIKSYLDYGAFTPIQVAATTALNDGQQYIELTRGIYRSRRDVLVDTFDRIGWPMASPKATMFLWTRIPSEFRGVSSMEFTKILINEAQVAVAPGIGFGEYGEGYVRIGLVENENRIRQAARNIQRMINNAEQILSKYRESNNGEL